jgi:hypothetical protein
MTESLFCGSQNGELLKKLFYRICFAYHYSRTVINTLKHESHVEANIKNNLCLVENTLLFQSEDQSLSAV